MVAAARLMLTMPALQATEIVSNKHGASGDQNSKDESWPIDLVLQHMDNLFSGLIVGQPACVPVNSIPLDTTNVSLFNASDVCAAFTDSASLEDVPPELLPFLGEVWKNWEGANIAAPSSTTAPAVTPEATPMATPTATPMAAPTATPTASSIGTTTSTPPASASPIPTAIATAASPPTGFAALMFNVTQASSRLRAPCTRLCSIDSHLNAPPSPSEQAKLRQLSSTRDREVVCMMLLDVIDPTTGFPTKNILCPEVMNRLIEGNISAPVLPDPTPEMLTAYIESNVAAATSRAVHYGSALPGSYTVLVEAMKRANKLGIFSADPTFELYVTAWTSSDPVTITEVGAAIAQNIRQQQETIMEEHQQAIQQQILQMLQMQAHQMQAQQMMQQSQMQAREQTIIYLAQSGLSQDEINAQLAQMGFDSNGGNQNQQQMNAQGTPIGMASTNAINELIQQLGDTATVAFTSLVPEQRKLAALATYRTLLSAAAQVAASMEAARKAVWHTIGLFVGVQVGCGGNIPSFVASCRVVASYHTDVCSFGSHPKVRPRSHL